MSYRLFTLLCFFLSGTTGLIYQVLWTRFMGGIIGNTHFSITIVVAVFMGGLALGSYYGGKLADRSARPLRLYGFITVLAGIACLLVPVVIHVGRPLFAHLYQFYDGQPQATPLLTVRILFCALLLIVPTSFMGATLPALSRYFARRLDQVGGTVGMLYTINTLGAVFGAAFTGFLAIPYLGLWGCTILGVTVDLILGVLILIISREETPVTIVGAKSTEPATESRVVTALPRAIRLAIIAFAISGFANMLLQIAWTKAIILTIGNSTYAFSLIVTLFILGIAIGGGTVSLFIDRMKNLTLVLGIVIFVSGVLVSASIPLLGHFPVLGSRLFDQVESPAYGKFLWIQVLLVSAVILPSTISMGMVFPIVGKIRTRVVDEIGSAVGSAYFWNTFGSILGTLVSGFILVPLLGMVYYTLYVGAGISLVLGAVLIHNALDGGSQRRFAIVGVALAVVLVPAYIYRPYGVFGSDSHLWHPSLLSRGSYAYYHNSYFDQKTGKVRSAQDFINEMIFVNRVLLYKEGVHAPIAVVEHGKTREKALRISGKVEASSKADGSYNDDLPHQIMAGHLPMLLHSGPKNVLTLGLGGGVTLGTLTLYDDTVESIDSLEISPEVVAAARDYFAKANRGAIRNPIVRNVIGDGRNHIEYTDKRFDVITSVPSNPWIAGIGNLFTVEFFQTCRDRLRDGGIMCNWIHKINMRDEDFRTVVRTFVEVFGDHAQLWDLGLDCMLIGSKGPIRFDAARFDERLKNPEIARDLAGLGITDVPTFLKHYRLNTQLLQQFVGEGPRNSDNFPVLEFSCPYGLYGYAFDAYRGLTAAGRAPLETSWLTHVSDEQLRRGNILQEAFLLQEVVRADDSKLGQLATRRLRAGLALDDPKLFQMAMKITDGLKAVEASLREGKDPWLEERTVQLAAQTLDVEAAPTLSGTLARYLLKIASHSPRGETQMNYLEEARPYLGTDQASLLLYARLWLAAENPQKAIPDLRKALESKPDDGQIMQTLGVLFAASRRPREALQLFQRALALTEEKPLRSEILQNQGYTLEKLGLFDEAFQAYLMALEEYPDNSEVQRRLERLQARRATGN